MKSTLKLQAIELRKQGFSYTEIIRQIPIARSTLSDWLHSVGLSKRQKQRLTIKRLEAAKRGGQAKRQQRLKTIKRIKQEASKDITNITKKELWLMGIMLYWAEGSKDKDHKPGQGIVFSNSDPFMIKIFLKWLAEIIEVSRSSIVLEIYIHENNRNRIEEVKNYWSNATGFISNEFDRIYFKKHLPTTNRKNIGTNYYGQLRVKIRKSSNLNRRIAGWIEAICLQCGVV